jgi:hypothetical protein
MALSVAPLILPAHARTSEQTHAAQETALLSQQSQEDLCLAERVERALRATGYGPLRGIAVTVQARLVILSGRVPSYYLKQIAQTIALAVAGACQVRNDLDVGGPQPRPPAAGHRSEAPVERCNDCFYPRCHCYVGNERPPVHIGSRPASV